MWGLQTHVIHVVVGALENIPRRLNENLNVIRANTSNGKFRSQRCWDQLGFLGKFLNCIKDYP